jgi:hypothetical protein
MKKYARFLVAIAFLLGLGVAAKGETRAEIVVTYLCACACTDQLAS